MSWESEVRELERRRELARQQGGREGIAKQHARGRLTIRERIDALLDPDSFREQGRATAIPDYDANDELTGYVPANYVVGLGHIDGRRVAVGGEDFTLKGGSPNAAGLRKSVYAEHMAVHYRVPLVRLLEGGGGSVKGSGRKGGTVGEPVFSEPRFRIIADAMGQIPIASAALGAVAGFPAGRLVASHFSVMTRYTAQVLIGGPALVDAGPRRAHDQGRAGWRRDTHQKRHRRQPGRGRRGRVCADPPLSVLPAVQRPGAARRARIVATTRDGRRRRFWTSSRAIPTRPFDARRIVELVMDVGSFFEVAPFYGRSQICGFARLNGQPVGVLANDCRIYAGAMTAEAAQKYRRLVELCDTFHLPIVNFVDQPGFMIGPEAERSGTIRYGMAAVSAAVQASVPWASVQVHKGFGVATAAHYGSDAYVLAWPSVEKAARYRWRGAWRWRFTGKSPPRMIRMPNARSWKKRSGRAARRSRGPSLLASTS